MLSHDIMEVKSSLVNKVLKSVKVLEGGYTILYLSDGSDCNVDKLWLSTPWRLESDNAILLSFDEAYQTIIDKINSMAGIIIVNVDISMKSMDFRLELSNGFSFYVPVCRKEGDLWEIRLSSGVRFGVGEGYKLIRWQVDD